MEDRPLMVASQVKVQENYFDWTYGDTGDPKVEDNAYVKEVSFGLLESYFTVVGFLFCSWKYL